MPETRRAQTAEAHVENRRDGAERQPQAGARDREGIQHQNREPRQCQHARGPRSAMRPQRREHDPQHQHRALHRRIEAGEQRVQTRDRRRPEQRRTLRWQPQAQRRPGGPQPTAQEKRDARDQRDVEAGDGDQVAGARSPEHLPVLARDGGLIAHRQRREHGRGRMFRQGAGDGVHENLPPLEHAVARGAVPAHGLAHRGGGADARAEHPAFVVEAAGVQRAVRRAQPQRETPAFAAAHGRALVVPGHADAPRYRGVAGRVGRVGREQEAQALRIALRQAGDAALEHAIAAVRCHRPALVEQPLRAPDREQHAEDRRGPQRAAAPWRQRRQARRGEHRCRGQAGAEMHGDHAGGESKRCRDQAIPRSYYCCGAAGLRYAQPSLRRFQPT